MNATRIRNDVNGNPRYVIHWLDLEPETGRDRLRATLTLAERYARVVRAANKVGGRRYHCRAYGDGVVFQAYECQLSAIAARVRALLEA